MAARQQLEGTDLVISMGANPICNIFILSHLLLAAKLNVCDWSYRAGQRLCERSPEAEAWGQGITQPRSRLFEYPSSAQERRNDKLLQFKGSLKGVSFSEFKIVRQKRKLQHLTELENNNIINLNLNSLFSKLFDKWVKLP